MKWRSGAAGAVALALSLIVVSVAATALAPLAAQSTMARTPNLQGGWIGESGTVRFHFLHRFENSGAPERQVGNRPTFMLGYARPPLLFGAHYATRSAVEPGLPNEWELFGRAGLGQLAGGGSRVAATAAYNAAASAFDGELAARTGHGRVDALGSVRLLGGSSGQAARTALGGGVIVRLTRYTALSADATTLLDRSAEEKVAWGAGLQIAIPGSPHSLSLQATNTNSATLRGSAVGEARRRYGFEFTVPITLRRYFGGGQRTARAADNGDDPGAPPTIEPTLFARIHNLAYAPDSITVPAGTTIVWTNDDPLEHTVTATDRSWDSGNIAPGASWRRRFTEPGRYEFLCTPHPFMTGVVIVQ